jgi:hypothetical protein
VALMSERRIDLTKQNHDPQAALKQIAGLIQKLSYREMNQLADIVGNNIPGDTGGPEAVAKGLLAAADAILTPPAALKMPAPAPGDWRR